MANDSDILKDARQAFTQCQDAWSRNAEAAKDDITFARLGEQWPKDVVELRGPRRPMLTINKLPAFIRQVVNDSRQNKPSIKVHPVDSGADKRTAEIMSGLIRNIEYSSNADVAYDTAVECAVTGGFGYFRIGVGHAFDDAFDMDITIDRVADPLSIYPDPYSTAADSSDWNVCFATNLLSKEAFERQYKGAIKQDWDGGSYGELAGTPWMENDSILVAEYWTREEYDKPILLLSTGEIIDASRMKDEAFAAMLQANMVEVKNERVAKCYRVKQRIMTGAEVLDETDWQGRYIPIVPVYGDEVNINGTRHFRSLIRDAKDAQRMFNYWRTTATELVALAPRVPFIGPKGAFKTDNAKWQSANTANHSFIEYDGAVPPQRQPLDSGVAAGALQEALNAADDMKAIIGIYDASLGARSNETSGKAIMARQREGDVSTFHFADNMSRAIRHAGRILIDLIPMVYSQERIIRVMGEDGSPESVPLKQPIPETDPQTGEPLMQPGPMGQMIPMTRIVDLAAGKYDLTVQTGPSYTTRRQEAAEQMAMLVQAVPDVAPVIVPMLARNSDWPEADKVADKLEAMSAPPEIPPEIEEAMGKAKEAVETLEAENADLKARHELEAQKLQMEAEKMQIDAQLEAQKLQLEQLKLQLEAQRMGLENQKLGMDAERMKFEGEGRQQDFKLRTAEHNKRLLSEEEEQLAGEGAPESPVQQIAGVLQQQTATLAALVQQMNAPKAVMRDNAGKIVGVQTVG